MLPVLTSKPLIVVWLALVPPFKAFPKIEAGGAAAPPMSVAVEPTAEPHAPSCAASPGPVIVPTDSLQEDDDVARMPVPRLIVLEPMPVTIVSVAEPPVMVLPVPARPPPSPPQKVVPGGRTREGRE